MRKVFFIKQFFILFLMLCMQSVTCSVELNDRVVSGTHSVEYFIRDPENLLIPVTVSTPGYSQRVRRIHRGYFVTITSSVQPIHVKPLFKFDPTRLDPCFDDAHLLKNLASVNNASDALRVCLSWLDSTVIYDDNPDHGQDVDIVLTRKSGNCVGRTAALLKLMDGLDLKARPVQGCLFQNGKLVFHRWLEVDYDGIGFFPTAPGSTQDFVSADHLVLLPSDKIDASANWVDDEDFSITLMDEKHCIYVIDHRSSPGGSIQPILRRKTDNFRLKTAVTGEIDPVGLQGVIEIKTSNEFHSIPIPSNSAFSFIPVSPGSYQLVIMMDGKEVFFTQDHIRSSEHKHHFCTIKTGAYGLRERGK